MQRVALRFLHLPELGQSKRGMHHVQCPSSDSNRILEGMIAEGRNSNPIVNHLLFNAASSMGYKIGGNDEVVGGKTSGEVLADYIFIS